MAFHDEVCFPGGIHFDGDVHQDCTDFSVQGAGRGGTGNPLTTTLHITTGTATFAVCGIPMKDLRRFGKWLVQMADEKCQEATEEFPDRDGTDFLPTSSRP